MKLFPIESKLTNSRSAKSENKRQTMLGSELFPSFIKESIRSVLFQGNRAKR